jgi:hypothetical protein
LSACSLQQPLPALEPAATTACAKP